MPTALLLLLAPLALATAAADAARRPGRRPAHLIRGEIAAAVALAVSMLGIVAVLAGGPSDAVALGLGARLDAVSAAMLFVSSLVGWAVLRYARTYLDGDGRQGAFHAGLCAALAAVTAFVTAGGLVQLVLGFAGTAVAIHWLLRFYGHRAGARRAAAKQALAAAGAGTCLLGAAALLGAGYGTLRIDAILVGATILPTAQAVGAAILLALAALLASAQMPVHGWVTDAMEAPTPVSALLHAGVVNAGGFLLIRFAPVMLDAPIVLAVLALAGGATALVAALVMLTQPAVKTALAWSTVAQMGFLLLQCGLGLFALALLHIAAHSFYKAHAFLSSGSAVETVAADARPGAVAVPGPRAVLLSFLVALAIYAAGTILLGGAGKAPQALALGAMLIFGTAYLVAQGLAEAAPRALTIRTSIAAAAATVAYFALQAGAEWWTRLSLPPVAPPGPLEWLVIALAVIGFGAVALAQAMLPLWAGHPAVRGLRVHLSNGLYADAAVERLLGLRIKATGDAP